MILRRGGVSRDEIVQLPAAFRAQVDTGRRALGSAVRLDHFSSWGTRNCGTGRARLSLSKFPVGMCMRVFSGTRVSLPTNDSLSDALEKLPGTSPESWSTRPRAAGIVGQAYRASGADSRAAPARTSARAAGRCAAGALRGRRRTGRRRRLPALLCGFLHWDRVVQRLRGQLVELRQLIGCNRARTTSNRNSPHPTAPRGATRTLWA